MIGLMIFCWAYLVFMLMGRVINYPKVSKGAIIVRVVDNITIIILIVILFFMYAQR